MTPPADAGEDGPAHGATTRQLLDDFALGHPDDMLKLGDVLSGLGPSGFGMLLFLGVLPAFIPIPGVGGAIGGPLVVLVGVQLLLGLGRMWLPGFVARRGPHRRALMTFRTLLSPWLQRLERVVRPRLPVVLDHRVARCFTGLQLLLLGLLLALPIPFTNYLFGVLLLVYALALLERDGALMLAAWLSGSIAIVVFGVVSGNLLHMLQRVVAGWF
ncbi:exopolysaccharide biosynthesis protein [Pseudoxanthomonas mexicana]|uniref:exopolysaccharide biosynthesis protein n=1 Tax=Pseudoxanthomonas mexicana TaxID=128785 RepID=UPI00398BA7C6